MRLFLLIAFILISLYGMSQESESTAVKRTIETFFEGFHKGDTTLMRSQLYKNVLIQTAFKNQEGKDVLVSEESAQKLLNDIASRPEDQKWDERLLNFSIQVDGNMANAWVDYEFWFNGEFSHCGVNSFQLFRDNGSWKIIYLIDTRRRSDCAQQD